MNIGGAGPASIIANLNLIREKGGKLGNFQLVFLLILLLIALVSVICVVVVAIY